MYRKCAALCFIFVTSLFAGSVVAEDASGDFHDIFEQRCLECHGHSGEFAREVLDLKDGVVVNKQGQPIEPFLTQHRGGLTPGELTLFLRVFANQLADGAMFQDRCIICHARAHEFVRLNLFLRDGFLVGRYSDHRVDAFLKNHANLQEAESERMAAALKAIYEGGR